ncbi:L-alanine-DL-glutamate epimerase-like enolase superfamily enzyme [Modicisalibacter xianhensis]|uniref:L-alanine-DL-glutamate epimerase-like enolase superfamily enzyme n=1 Tax=Modicisalibacter xianhensis TaxID=442341 RepID=A0A4R8G080_9GAMM|nr:enolase C-terminal domain-like protein [Halomonas xianhensis]TDX28417.1 L-alanine-DL-glutamate epimerase-like enolase superfamily enzyme [Halomonas xianhensis]
MTARIPIEALQVSAYKVPTDAPESDGTLAWDSTTLVLVELQASGKVGIGYTYGHPACAELIRDKLAGVIEGHSALDVRHGWLKMIEAIRNLGRPGICSMAISAVDVALWDLKARLLDVPLVSLLGAMRPAAPVYGSGGFTSYSHDQLTEQLVRWVEEGIPRVKMKIGREPGHDLERIRLVREAIGADSELYVDANGAYARKQALAMADAFQAYDVSWYEEPVTSDDLEGLRLLRDRAPGGVEITAGEYGYDLPYFRRMLEAGAVDVLQADLTRCGGITAFMDVAVLCDAFKIPLSSHTAPALHMHPGCCVTSLRHLEYFHDHARIEAMLFDGPVVPVGGMLEPDLSRPGLGLTFRRQEAERYRL